MASQRPKPEIRVVAPFPAFAIPRVWSWISEFRDRVADEYSPQTLEAFVEHWEAGDRAGRKRWAVYRDGELGGVITAQRLTPMVSDAHCIFAKRFWGAETTLASLRIAFAEIYGDGVRKISSTLFADNRAIIGLIHRLGGSVEGRLVDQTMRGGKLVDMVLVGIQKASFVKSLEGTDMQERGGIEPPAAEAIQPQPVIEEQQQSAALPDSPGIHQAEGVL